MKYKKSKICSGGEKYTQNIRKIYAFLFFYLKK